MAKLPSAGEEIPVERFHVSRLNVRAGEPFGQSEEDQLLIHQLDRGKIVAAFKARPEDDGFGVFVGRRRFLARKEAGAKSFVVGSDVVIETLDEEEAKEQSLIENLKILRKEMNPITRAEKLNEIVASSPGVLKGTARRLGISPATLSEWLRILDLSPRMQEAVSSGLLYYTDALRIARMKLGTELQNTLADTLKKNGVDAFQKELERHQSKRLKRGIPKGKYVILRITWDKVYPQDMNLYEKLEKLARDKRMKIDDYSKQVLEEHVKTSGL